MNPTTSLIAAAISFVLGTIFISAYSWYRQHQEQAHQRQKNRLLEHLINLLSTGDVQQKSISYRKKDLRSALIAVCKIVSGPMIDRARAIYAELGFLEDDVRTLQKSTRKAGKIRVLMGIRHLRADLPADLWKKLLHHESTAIRWLAMEAFIAARGQEALATLFEYVRNPKNQKPGVLIHLFSLYASINSAGLLTILADTHASEVTQLALLTTLRYYPHPGSESTILSVLQRSSNIELQRVGIETLQNYSSPAVLDALATFSQHADSGIKHAVAFALHGTTDERGLLILESLTTEMCHRVRRQAIESMCAITPSPERILRGIRSHVEHPSFELLKVVESSLKKAA